MIASTFGGIAFLAACAAIDWLMFGRLEAFYTDKEAPYRLPLRRAAVMLGFGLYTYWALVNRTDYDRLPPLYLIPALIGWIAWLILLFADFRKSLVDID